MKNLSTNELEWGGKPGNKWEHPSPVGKLISLNRIMSLVKNLPIQLRETGEVNRTGESIGKKPPELNVKMWEENRKIIDIIDKKTFQPGARTRKEKPRFVMRKGTWLE